MSEFSEGGYISWLDTYLPDNSTQEISPKDLRDSFINLVDSSHRFLEVHSIKGLNIESADYRQTKVGELALSKTYLSYESGVDNSAFGYAALNANVFGQYNTGLGSYALSCNLDGNHNVAVGFSSLIGNVEGHGNVAIGNRSLCATRRGSYNIAIGHGAGYYIDENNDYQFYLGAHPEVSGSCCEDTSGIPLMRGHLEELKLAIGTDEIHNYGTLQVKGDATPTDSRVYDLGNANRAWNSVNGVLLFPDANTIKSAVKILPNINGLDFGSEDLRWDGYFRNLNVSGVTNLTNLNYTTITSNLYESKTLHLATDGLCDGDNLGLGPGAVCGYLSDQGIDGAGFEVHSSGIDYRRDYKFVYRFPDLDMTCLENDSVYSRSHWESNISISTLPGRHVLTDRVLGRETLSLFNEDCCGIHISGCNYISLGEKPDNVCYSGVYLHNQDLNLTKDGSGIINQRFLSQTENCDNTIGFNLKYIDDYISGVSQSGTLFGIERIIESTSDSTKFNSMVIDISGNIGFSNTANFYDPQTIFNIYSSGDAALRVASSGLSKPSLELLGNGNIRASGFQIIYHTNCDDSYLNPDYGSCLVNINGEDKVVVDFDLIEASGLEGFEIGFLEATERGYVGIGRTREHNTRRFIPNEPLTINHNDCTGSSGTISIKEQAVSPTATSDYGKLYVKPYVDTNLPITQSPFFLDDDGNEYRLILNKFLHSDGLVYTDSKFNTAAGLGTPEDRPMSTAASGNTLYGFSAGHKITSGDDNVLIGYSTGSGIRSGSCNTVVGSKSMVFARGSNNVILGCNNIGLEATDDANVNNSILIGNDLKRQEEILDGTIQIGTGSLPIIDGLMSANSYLDFNVDYLNINDGDLIFTETGDFGDFKIRNSNNKLCILFSSGAIVDQEIACFNSGSVLEVDSVKFSDGTSIDTGSFASGHDIMTEPNFNPGFGVNVCSGYIAISHFINEDGDYEQSKVQLTDIADCFTSGGGGAGLTVESNCNFIWSNVKSSIDSNLNYGSVFIGCDAALNATGWKNNIAIGTEAGYEAKNTNPSLSIDTASIFLGYRAGYDADSVENSVFIGTNAGKQSSSASDSVFIGSNAGLYSQSKNSIGIGENALRGNDDLDFTNAGSGNIEIITGIEDSDRLLYQKEEYNQRINIQNLIAGNTANKTLSIGDAILNPDAPLSVRRDVIHDNSQWSRTAYSVLVDASGHEDDFTPDSGYLYPLYLFSTDAQNDPSHVPGSNVIVWGEETALSGFPTVTFYQPFIAGEVLGESGNLDQGSAGGYEIFESGSIPNTFIQTWYCYDELVAGVKCNGDITIKGNITNINNETIINVSGEKLEGFAEDRILAPVDFCTPTSGLFTKKIIDDQGNCTDGESIYVINRDTTLVIHSGAYIQAHRVNNEWRPIWISCSGTPS